MSDEVVSSKEKVVSVKTLWSAEEIDEPDNLGEGEGYVIKLWTGNFKRGLLIMPGPEGFFIPATRAGALDADELGILAMDMGIDIDPAKAEEGDIEEYTSAIAYFRGKLNGDAIIMNYETDEDNHDELLSELADKFRKQGLNIQ